MPRAGRGRAIVRRVVEGEVCDLRPLPHLWGVAQRAARPDRLGLEGRPQVRPGADQSQRVLREARALLNTVPERSVEEQVASAEEVEKWLRKLPSPHRETCREIYVEGRSQAAASEALGYSRSWVSYLHREAVAYLNDPERWKDPIWARMERESMTRTGDEAESVDDGSED